MDKICTISVFQKFKHLIAHSFICCGFFDTSYFMKGITQDDFLLNHLISLNILSD